MSHGMQAHVTCRPVQGPMPHVHGAKAPQLIGFSSKLDMASLHVCGRNTYPQFRIQVCTPWLFSKARLLPLVFRFYFGLLWSISCSPATPSPQNAFAGVLVGGSGAAPVLCSPSAAIDILAPVLTVCFDRCRYWNG